MDKKKKGGCYITEEILFEKYQILGILGRGSLGCVFLAKHLGLDELRAIKRVPRVNGEYDSFLKEAHILKELRHPGIPIVYDIEEDSDYGYLIEEYAFGDSVFALVKELGRLEEMKVVSYGIQLCQIISYLHSYKFCPILYLDLQPKNIFVSDDKIKLIDFNRAMLFSEANDSGKRYGTIGFAAPEQYTDGVLDERTDIYAIGMILYYMSSGRYPKQHEEISLEQIHEGLGAVIRTCLKENKEERFESVDMLEERLKELTEDAAHTKNPSLRISFAGSKAGTGTTHLVVSLLSFLYQKNISCLYDEQNPSGMVVKLARYQNIPISCPGELYIFGMAFKPYVGENVETRSGEYAVILKDFGSDIRRAGNTDADAVVLVSGGKSWEWADCVNAVRLLHQKQKFCIVWNHLDRQKQKVLPEELKGEIQFSMPYFQDVFRGSAERDSFLEEFWAYLKKDVGGWKKERLFGEKVRSIFRKRIGHGELWEFHRK